MGGSGRKGKIIIVVAKYFCTYIVRLKELRISSEFICERTKIVWLRPESKQ